MKKLENYVATFSTKDGKELKTYRCDIGNLPEGETAVSDFRRFLAETLATEYNLVFTEFDLKNMADMMADKFTERFTATIGNYKLHLDKDFVITHE